MTTSPSPNVRLRSNASRFTLLYYLTALPCFRNRTRDLCTTGEPEKLPDGTLAPDVRGCARVSWVWKRMWIPVSKTSNCMLATRHPPFDPNHFGPREQAFSVFFTLMICISVYPGMSTHTKLLPLSTLTPRVVDGSACVMSFS